MMNRINLIFKYNFPWQITIVFLTMCMIVVTTACAANQGSLRRNPEITEAFESYQVLPNHRYYHLGWANRPYAVVGIQESYQIKSNQWIEFDPEPQTLKRVVDAVEIFSEWGYYRAFGSYILGAKGNRIGVWYSSLWIASVQVDEASKLVSFTTDQPWVRGDRFDL